MEAKKNNAEDMMAAFARAIKHQGKQRENVDAAFNDVKHDVSEVLKAEIVKMKTAITLHVNQSIEKTKEETCKQLKELMSSANTECE